MSQEAPCIRVCTKAQPSGPVFYWKQVPGEVVFGVIALCVVLLLLQHVALKSKSTEAG